MKQRAFVPQEWTESPAALLQSWRRRVFNLFTLLVLSVQFPGLLAALLKPDLPRISKVLVASAWLSLLVTVTLRRLPHQLRVWLLIATTWLFTAVMLARAGVHSGFPVVMVATPEARDGE
jgi:hypothetical protein